MLKRLKEKVLRANISLVKYNLVTLTWGNVSGIDRKKGLMAIKPSGVDYGKLKLEDIVIVNMEGKVVEGNLNPSSDTPTHIEIYKNFPDIGGITHSHSEYATIFAQAAMEIPCYGTTHADHFNGVIPVTRLLSKDEVDTNYEFNTGKVIVERFKKLNYESMPAVLVAGHAPFTWGKDPEDSVKNNLVLERVAKMALHSLRLKPDLAPLPDYVLKKHHTRKHGKDAYYGQKK
jgi:L-ribulose-5-phosphate 4-epimerase